ncbi:MAG: hypothetical protein RJA49_1224 [Actinomycetota bacterium]
MSFSSLRVRLLFGGAALALVGLTTAGCTSDSSNVSANNAQNTSTTAPVTVATPSTVPATTIVTTVDPAPVLQKAIGKLSKSYHFSSKFVVNGAVTLTAEGDRVGDSSRLTVTQNGATVAYIVTPTATYAQPSNGEWQLLDTPPAATDPITALSAPAAIGVLSDDGTSTRLRVTVSALTLGVGATGNADVEVVMTKGVIKEVDYGTTKDGNVASVATVISKVVDATPISAPI